MIAAGQAGVTLTSVGRFTGDTVKLGGSEAPLDEMVEIYRTGFDKAHR